MSSPFELSVSLSEAEYEKYGPVLQKVLVNLLSDSPLGELNSYFKNRSINVAMKVANATKQLKIHYMEKKLISQKVS